MIVADELELFAGRYIRVPSAKSSFFRFILSFKFSASRRACWIRVCIASGETSFDMIVRGRSIDQDTKDLKGSPDRCRRDGWLMEVRATYVGGSREAEDSWPGAEPASIVELCSSFNQSMSR